MKKMGDGLSDLVSRLAGRDLSAADALRRAAVLALWEDAVNAVFKEAARLVLDHTNAVYILSGDKAGAVRRFDRPASETRGIAVDGEVLVVYADDSMVRSELDNRQELLMMKMRAAGEDVELFKIIPSTRDMKRRHPYRAPEDGGRQSRVGGNFLESSQGGPPAAARRRALSQGEVEEIGRLVGKVEDERVSRALEKAMIASRESQNGDNEEI